MTTLFQRAVPAMQHPSKFAHGRESICSKRLMPRNVQSKELNQNNLQNLRNHDNYAGNPIFFVLVPNCVE